MSISSVWLPRISMDPATHVNPLLSSKQTYLMLSRRKELWKVWKQGFNFFKSTPSADHLLWTVIFWHLSVFLAASVILLFSYGSGLFLQSVWYFLWRRYYRQLNFCFMVQTFHSLQYLSNINYKESNWNYKKTYNNHMIS